MKIAPHRLVLGGLAVLSLALTGCSGDNHHHGAADPTTSATAGSSASSTAPSTTSSAPAATTSTPASSGSSATQSVSATADPEAEAAVASPGTSCGPVEASVDGTIYIDGGPVGCAEAKRITKSYFQQDFSNPQNNHLTAEIEGYDCSLDRGARRPLEGRNAVCVNASTGAYVDVRPSDLRILRGPIAEPVDYPAGDGLGAEEYTAQAATFFTTPDRTAGCGIDVEDTLDCWSMSAKDAEEWRTKGSVPFNHVHLTRTGAVTTELEGSQDLRVELSGKELDEGTVMNAMSFSCQATSASQMHCVSPDHGFTISEQGVTED